MVNQAGILFDKLYQLYQIKCMYCLIPPSPPHSTVRVIFFDIYNQQIIYLQKEKKAITVCLKTKMVQKGSSKKQALSKVIQDKLVSKFKHSLSKSKAVGITMDKQKFESLVKAYQLNPLNKKAIPIINQKLKSIYHVLSVPFLESNCAISYPQKWIEELLIGGFNCNKEASPGSKSSVSSSDSNEPDNIFSIQSFHKDCLELLTLESPPKKRLTIKMNNPNITMTIDHKKAVVKEEKGGSITSKIECKFDEHALYLNNIKQSDDFLGIFHKKIQSIHKGTMENRTEFFEEV